MALTQAQRDAIKANLNLDTLDTYASNPDSLIEQMTPEQLLEGLKCGTLSLEQLNYLFFLGFTATEKALAESKAYTDGKTTELANKLNFCNALSSRSGNLLQVDGQPDGSCKFYYGIEPPANLANQYVDPVNGQDSNDGSRASPLRTILRAIDNLPTGTRAAIHLHENAAHYLKSSERRVLDKEINFYTYGPDTDIAQATWDTDLSGWGWHGWQNSPKARVEFVNDALIGGIEPGKHKSNCLEVLNGVTLHFAGIKFVTGPDINMTNQPFWRAAMTGNGDIILVDCAADVQALPLFSSSPDQQPRITMNVVDITGSYYLFVLGSGGKITVAAYERPIGKVNQQGLLFNTGLPVADYASRVQNRSTTIPVSPNFDANF